MNRLATGFAAPPKEAAQDPTDSQRDELQEPATLVMSGSLQRDLLRLGVVPCAAAALALTAWFTHSRLNTLEDAFNAEGQAIARQVAALSDLSLYAGDLSALAGALPAQRFVAASDPLRCRPRDGSGRGGGQAGL